MSKKGKLRFISGLVLSAIVVGIIVADLLYRFGNFDTPFIIAFVTYIFFCIIVHSKSRVTFGIVVFLIIVMACSYVISGEFRLTERIGEWFYLFFIFGLLQYIREAWIIDKK